MIYNFSLLTDLAALPLRAKRKPAEVYLTGKRLQEEVKLLEEEMRRFLCYYRDNLMPNLSARLNFIEKGLCMTNQSEFYC